MTTKHVVADDLIGQVARKQWELNRRILEGTLDPERLLQSLQQLIEGHAAKLPIEATGFTVSDQVYVVDVQRKGDFHEIARSCSNIGQCFSIYHDPPTCKLEVPNGSGPKRVKLSLAHFDIGAQFAAAMTMLETEGHILADAWDLLALTNKAPMFKTVPGKEFRIYALGTVVRSCFQERNYEPGERQIVSLTARQKRHGGVPHARWSLESGSLESNSGGVVQAGQYVLVRRK